MNIHEDTPPNTSNRLYGGLGCQFLFENDLGSPPTILYSPLIDDGDVRPEIDRESLKNVLESLG
eukprot:scaffold33562_cov125-Skeletonema_dohrnii-CCMP3373.AAC.2